MPIRLANSRHICSRIAKILQNLPQITAAVGGVVSSGNKAVITKGTRAHTWKPTRSNKSTKELGFCPQPALLLPDPFQYQQELQQRIGTVDSLIASHPVVLRSICTRITNKVQRLHQLIIGTTTTQHIIASQQRIIQERLLWKSIDIIQVLIYGS